MLDWRDLRDTETCEVRYTRHCRLSQEETCSFRYWKKVVYLTGLITPLLLIWEWMGSFLKKKDLLRYWSNLSKLNWMRALRLTIAKTVSKKIETLISCLKFLCLEVALYFFKGTIRPGMENYFHVCAGASRCFIVEIS